MKNTTGRVLIILAWTAIWVGVSAVLGTNYEYWRSGMGAGGTPLWSTILWFVVCSALWGATAPEDKGA